MKIEIMSRRDVSSLLRKNNHSVPSKTRIISIRNTDQKRLHKDCDDILNLRFDDVLGNDDNRMTDEQARFVKCFAENAWKDGVDLIVHCHGGVSRSAGCAAAIIDGLKHQGCEDLIPNDGLDIWFDPRYVPNEFVYALVLEQFGVHVSEDEIRKLLYDSAEAWLQAHESA